MKKALALLVVLVMLAIPMVAFAHPHCPRPTTPPAPTDGVGLYAGVENYNQSFYMFPVEAAAEETETTVELPAIDPSAAIPAAGSVVFAGLSAVMALLGCALIPKK